jgi:hypothetical protein
MNLVGAVFADFVEAPLGGASQLMTPLASRTVLEHTLRRLLQVTGLERRCLFVRPRDADAAAEALANAGLQTEIELLATDDAPRPRRNLLRAARKWNIESWRGGVMGTTWFDEFVDAQALAIVIDHYQCEGVLALDGHQAALDPHVATAMLRHAIENEFTAKTVFTQAPPGLAGVIVRRENVEDLLQLGLPLGLLLSYRPEMARFDPITQPACYHVVPEVAQTTARLVGDTRRGRELLAEALAELGEGADAERLCTWVRAPGHDRAGALPVEIELELTTRDARPESTLRPPAATIGERELSDLAAVARLAESLATCDDRLVVLGGHGDPLLHPDFPEVCRLLRTAGVFGIAVVTPLIELSDVSFAALFDHEIDVLEVPLDAHTPATYERVHGIDAFAQVRANIDRIEQHRRQHRAPRPILVPSLTRCAATMAELEPFYDDWIRMVGSAAIRGYNDHAGLLAADSLLPTHPPVRVPCRRLWSRLMLLADGRVAQCSQDVGGAHAVGDWTQSGVADLWGSAALIALRAAHEEGRPESLPMCPRCTQWDRP